MQWILGLALAALLYVILTHWAGLPPERKKVVGWKLAMGVFAGALLLLVVTGRMNVIVAGIAALLPALRKLPALVRYLPMLKRMKGWLGEDAADGNAGRDQQRSHRDNASAGGQMAEAEARDILGVPRDFSRDDVVNAHRRLMQKLHPDRGGNDYLAAKVNEAKAVLLKLSQA